MDDIPKESRDLFLFQIDSINFVSSILFASISIVIYLDG